MAVVIIIHGLNNDPAIMDPIANVFRNAGHIVRPLILSGHGENADSFDDVSAPIWLDDLDRAVHFARDAFPDEKLWVVGFSLGALLAIVWQLENNFFFAKAIYLAPAFALHSKSLFIKTFLFLPRTWSVPSFASRPHRRWPHTSIAAYRGLFQLINNLKTLNTRLLDRDTLVLIHEKDELIDVKKIKEFISKNKLSKWEFYSCSSQAEGRWHHPGLLDLDECHRKIQHFLGT